MTNIHSSWRKLSSLQKKLLIKIVFRGCEFSPHIITNENGMQSYTIYSTMLTEKEKALYKTCEEFEKNVLTPMVNSIIFVKFHRKADKLLLYALTPNGFDFVRNKRFILYRWHYDYSCKSPELYRYIKTTLLPILLTAIFTGIMTAICTVLLTEYFKKHYPSVLEVRLLNESK